MIKEKRNGAGYYIFFGLSSVSFILALISLWQGIVSLKHFEGEFSDLQEMIHSFFTFQNEGLIFLSAAFFLFIVALQFSVYALLLKK
ncbi:MAG: hypothetical protein D6830_00300 [Ignavibacteria bacterium]|nr:MAG: hypothetical protein D6830_00300 [Ignavibacteria bacterium]